MGIQAKRLYRYMFCLTTCFVWKRMDLKSLHPHNSFYGFKGFISVVNEKGWILVCKAGIDAKRGG